MSALTTGGTLALAPVVPLTLTAHTRGTSTPPNPRPAPDRSGLWLRNAAAGLCVLAAAAAAVSFTAQYRMVDATRHLPVIAALEAAIPDAAALVFACLGIALALHGRRALRARALNLASVGASVFMNAIAAEPGWRNLAIWAMPPVAYALASDTLIGVVRAWALARHQHLDRRRGHPAGHPRRPAPVAAPPGPGPRLHPGRVPRLGPGRVPGRPRPPAGARAAPAEGDQDGPVPGSGHRTARASRLHPAQPRRRDQRRPGPPARPEHRRRPHRPAQSRPGRPQRRPPMIIKLAILLAVLLIVAAFAAWAFLPARHLPGNRARHLRIRLHLRLHPGKGFAHVFSLWLRWSRFAVAAPLRPDPPRPALRYSLLDPREHSVFLGRAHYRHGLRVPLEEHLLVMAPPRTYKTAFLADVIMRYPGPVIATTTKPDIYALTSAVRAQPRPGARVQPAAHRRRPVHLLLVPRSTAARTRPPRSAAPTRSRSPSPRRASRTAAFWSAKASDYLRGYFHAAALADYDLRAVAAWVSGADPDVPERILAAAGAHQWAVTLAELRSEAQKTTATVRMVMSRALAFMADPALAACVLPAPGDRLRHPRVPVRRRHRVHDRRSRLRGSPGRPAVRRHGHRDPLRRRADRPGVAVAPAGPAAADGPGRGDPDLPGPAAVLAVGLRRQGHPGRRRRARRSPAHRPLGRPRPPGRPRHQLGEGVPARHHRRHHPATRPPSCAARRRGRSAARTTPPATTSPPRT